MEYLELKNQKPISKICFGCWAIGGHGYGDVDDKQSTRAIEVALAHGINFFDTAGVYGLGHSETVLGKALGTRRHDAFIASKCGVHWDENNRLYKDCAPNKIIESVEASLRRLQLDSLPLLQVHWLDGKTDIDAIMQTLLTLKAQGKIQHIGFCNTSSKQLIKAKHCQQIEFTQNKFNLKYQSTIESDTYGAYKPLFMAYEVLLRGLLSGRTKSNLNKEETDTRTRDPNYQGDEYQRNLKLFELISSVAERYEVKPQHIAIRWALDFPGVDSTILGMKSESQVLDNLKTFSFSIEENDMTLLKHAWQQVLDMEQHR